MAYRKVNDTSLASVADAIREKGGTSDALVFPEGFVSAISAIQTGAAEPVLQEKTVTYTSNGTTTITPDEGYDGLSSVDVTVDVASGGSGFNVSISIDRAFTGDTLVTGLIEETIPVKHNTGSISVQSKMSYGGAIFMGEIATSSMSYEYIANLSNMDVYFYSYTTNWTKCEKITSFPYRFPSDTLKAIFIPVADNAIINISYEED